MLLKKNRINELVQPAHPEFNTVSTRVESRNDEKTRGLGSGGLWRTLAVNRLGSTRPRGFLETKPGQT